MLNKRTSRIFSFQFIYNSKFGYSDADGLDLAISETGLKLPLFVSCLIVGILMSNIIPLVLPRLPWPARTRSLALISDVSLSLFLSMSLVSLELSHLADAFLPILVAVGVQIAVALAYARWVVYPGCGRGYDAAVISTGFVGLGLGATPVGMANMEAVTDRYGPSPKALLVVPLIGAGVLDIANAAVIQLGLEFLMYPRGDAAPRRCARMANPRGVERVPTSDPVGSGPAPEEAPCSIPRFVAVGASARCTRSSVSG